MPYINVHFTHQRLCETGRIPLIYCNELMPNGISTEKHYQTSATATNTIGQRMDAVIYSMVVAVFYAGIILIILLTNAHRFRTNRKKKSKNKTNKISRLKLKKPNIGKHIVVHSNNTMTVVNMSDKYNETVI